MIDSSFSITETVSPINGYIVARAPKGTQRATYFSQNNEPAIDALMGVGSAHWPDLLEAKAYNQEYPIYISAPPGTSAAYPSYLGGFYITKRGLYKFYNVSDIQEVQENSGNAYLTKVRPGLETEFDGDFFNKLTTITIGDPNLLNDYTSPDGTFVFTKTSTLQGSYLTLTKNARLNVSAIDYDPMEQGEIPLASTVTTNWGDNSVPDPLWNFAGQAATMADFGIVYTPSQTDRNPLRDWIGVKNYDLLTNYETVDVDPVILYQLFRTGFVDLGNDETLVIPFGIQDFISFKVSIKDETYAYFAQKGCQEIPTNVRISQIGYDKYRYDILYPTAPYDPADFKTSKELRVTGGGNPDTFKEHEFVLFYNKDDPSKAADLKIGQLVVAGVPGAEDIYYVDETDSQVTKYVSCLKDLVSAAPIQELYHNIFYVESATSIKHLLTEEQSIAKYGENGLANYIAGLATGISAPKSPTFNQITLSCSEEVHAGKQTSGGEFEGSLDELGKTTFGVDNYFPLILQDDDVSFLLVRVDKKFGDNQGDLDETGFWTGKRIIDPYDIDNDREFPVEKSFTIEGDRYCVLVATMNQLELKTGGIYRDEYFQIIKDGLVEGLLPEYDDVYIYMEPTGQEVFKSDLFALSNVGNKLAAVISPKILTPNSRGVFTDIAAQKVIVNGRVSSSSNAQYAGEFEFYDPIARKKYWCQPIGDVACNLARIFELKYGGWAPAWTNISGDLGGQLKRSVLRSRYQFEDEATHTLDTKGINPIVFTSDYGLMITSHRTTQDPTNMSDWCYLGHSMSFQHVKREIRDSVLIPQVLKPINDYWMGIRQIQVDGILAKRTSGASPIWASATCDVAGQNTAFTKAARNFVIKVIVKANVFSESCTLVLETQAQTM